MRRTNPITIMSRLGPNPLLTFGIWVAAGLQAISFNLRSDVFFKGPFQVLLICSLLAFWMAIVWGVWFLMQTAARVRANKARKAAFLGAGAVVYLLALLYLFCWIVYAKIGAFPDLQWVAFFRSSFGVLLYEAQRQSPLALPIFGICGLLLAGAIPVGVRLLFLKDPPEGRHSPTGRAVLLAWLALTAAAVGSFAVIRTTHDVVHRQFETMAFRRSVDPLFTLAADLFGQSDDTILPNINPAKLVPIVTDAQLYADAAKTPARTNVLFLVVESLRGDLLFQEHQGKQITPNLNSLARRSLVFTNMHAQATHTDYALPSLLSSQYPLRVQGHYYYKRQEDWPKTLIYDHLSHFGYETAIISSDTTNWGDVRNFLWSDKLSTFLDAENMPTSFTAPGSRGYVTDFKETPRTQIKSIPDRDTIDYDIAWLNDAFARGKRVFLHSFFYQPHYPYKIPSSAPPVFQPSTIDFESNFLWFPPEKMDVMMNAYLNAVHETDAQIGRLLKYFDDSGQTSNTLIVVTADHGEAFGEHGKVTHAGPLFGEVVRIPLIISGPGVKPGFEDYPVQQIDVVPTVCKLLNLPAHPGFQGIDVLSANRPPIAERDLFLHAEPPSSWRGDALLHANRWKLWHDRYVDLLYLYDLQTDPGETQDISHFAPPVAEPLKAKLQAWRNDQLSYYAFKSYHEHYYPPKTNVVDRK